MASNVMKLVSNLTLALFLSLAAFATDAKTSDPAKPAETVDTPRLTDAQKLAVRSAQVDFYEAKAAKEKADADFSKAQEALTKSREFRIFRTEARRWILCLQG